MTAAGSACRTSVRGQIAAVGIVIVIGVGAPVVIEAVTQAGCETPTATEMPPVVADVAGRCGKVLTRNAAAAELTPAEPIAHVSTTTEPTAHVSTTTEPTTANVSTTTEPTTAHVTAAAEPTAATVSAPATPASPAARKRVSGQSPGESGSRSQNDHGLT
jgi:cytoskeletal protein RodZ